MRRHRDGRESCRWSYRQLLQLSEPPSMQSPCWRSATLRDVTWRGRRVRGVGGCRWNVVSLQVSRCRVVEMQTHFAPIHDTETTWNIHERNEVSFTETRQQTGKDIFALDLTTSNTLTEFLRRNDSVKTVFFSRPFHKCQCSRSIHTIDTSLVRERPRRFSRGGKFLDQIIKIIIILQAQKGQGSHYFRVSLEHFCTRNKR